MKQKLYLKHLAVAFAFTVAFVGVTFAKKQNQTPRNESLFSLVSLGSQSMAYCNEAKFSEPIDEVNNGCCNGAFNDSNSRCVKGTESGVTYECIAY